MRSLPGRHHPAAYAAHPHRRRHGAPGDLGLLERLAGTVARTSLCGLGQAAPNPVFSTLRYFRDEYLAHLEEGTCPVGVCPVATREPVS